MSNRFESDLRRAIAMACGAHHTREARVHTAEMLAAALRKAGYIHLRSVADIGLRHLRAYVQARLSDNISPRTLANEVSHVRTFVRMCGNEAWLDDPASSNKALGVPQGSRIGTKVPLTADQIECAVCTAFDSGRPGMAAIIGLQLHLGLRGAEAIFADSETLKRWMREAGETGQVHVVRGTKGGRPRWSVLPDVAAALDAIDQAFAVARVQRGFLVVRKNGAPAGSLKSARSIYHSWMSRCGIQPHALRYQYAIALVKTYESKGLSRKEALAATSLSLGHGDGRGRWVKSVYCRSLADKTPTRE